MQSSDNKIQLGDNHGGNAHSLRGERDAAHVPVIMVELHREAHPGEWMGVDTNFTTRDAACVGVVDPFATEKMFMGDIVPLLLPPGGKTTDVKHVWSNPNVPEPKTSGSTENDKETFRDYCDNLAKILGCTTLDLMESAHSCAEYGPESGGQPSLIESTDVVDWAKFWDLYNRANNTNLSNMGDPFCC